MLAAVVVVIVVVIVVGIALLVRRRPTSVGLPIRYTTHARERMQQRGVDAADIERVLARPARVLPDAGENSVRLEGDFRGRLLKVWVVAPWPSKDEIVVKSTAWNYVLEFTIPRNAVGRVVGKGGATIEGIRRMSGAQISVDRTGAVRINGGSAATVKAAKSEVLAAARG